ncbi:PH domain-containing protein [Streptomyces thermoalcalitolerans]|uniref:PH domain-containing protein n=1 Tax=Streptomyces thermoalcalitolerans TaxID=65605 RepID=UPI0031DB8BA5
MNAPSEERLEFLTPDRTRTLVFVVVCVVLGAFGLARVALGHMTFVETLGIALLALAPFLLNVAFGKTVVDQEGIRTGRPLRRCFVPWPDIESVAVEEKAGRGYGAHRVRLRTGRGRTVWLAAPYVEIRCSEQQYARFSEQADRIIQRWHQAREPR